MTVPHPAMLHCQDVVELLTELLSDALEPADRVRVEQHLLVCPPCTAYLGQVRATIELAGELRDHAADVTVSPALRDAFRKTKDGVP